MCFYMVLEGHAFKYGFWLVFWGIPYNWLVLVTKAKIRTIHGHKLDTDHLRFVKVSSLSPLSTLAILIATGGKDLGSENVQVCFCQFW